MADDSHKAAGALDITSLTPDLRYTDLREWIDEAKALGESLGRNPPGAGPELAGRYRHGVRGHPA
jgi:hypothetical protein